MRRHERGHHLTSGVIQSLAPRPVADGWQELRMAAKKRRCTADAEDPKLPGDSQKKKQQPTEDHHTVTVAHDHACSP